MPVISNDNSPLIGKAQAYVEASNKHDMARIGPMLSDHIAYASSGVGGHEGASAVLRMMATFHEANPEVHWQAENYRLIAREGVEFDFIMTLGGAEHRGVERIFFAPDGLIRRIEVER